MSLVFFLAAWALWSPNVGLDLSKVDQLNQEIVKVDLTSVVTKKGIRESALVFRLKNYDFPFRVYRPLPKYEYLINNLKTGDSVQIYFNKWSSDNFVSDIYQLEKNGQILLDYKDYDRKYFFLSLLLILIGTFAVIHTLYQFRKTENSR